MGQETQAEAHQTATNFGLINRTYPSTDGLTANLTQWQKFEAQVNALNAAAPLNTAYKVLFMGRHGEGVHNAAESYYGTPAWNCYWAELNGNATNEWFDADLTPNGIKQALIAHDFWAHEIAVQKIPYPQSYYTSPLTRCLKTANYTFAGLEFPKYYPFVPTVRELLREGISIHTCDHRRSRTCKCIHIPECQYNSNQRHPRHPQPLPNLEHRPLSDRVRPNLERRHSRNQCRPRRPQQNRPRLHLQLRRPHLDFHYLALGRDRLHPARLRPPVLLPQHRRGHPRARQSRVLALGPGSEPSSLHD